MTKLRLLFLVTLCAVWPATASAQFNPIEWLQDGSGPGPYHNGYGFFVRLFCVKEAPGGRHNVDTCIADTDNSIKIVVDAEYGHASTNNPRFNDPVALLEPLNTASVNAHVFDVSYSYRVSPLLDVGVAIGSLTYTGEGFANQSHLTLTPLRISFVPLAYFSGEKGEKWGRVVRIKYWNRRVVGDILASDFGSKGSYVRRGEFNQGISVGLDFYAFIAALHK
jgi:hypothetical protein